ncbi:hypothetical protein [Microbacterium sp.]|uniref:hypothetical protein n=1 Tax=Microbacterium sp. TaxID=51671 RepID=UPI0027339FA6|nr:hypothetical protein [Microbacterium sp.]MDP3949533.1 hypothetical protein [Microbacterium sp.]
MPTTIDLSAAWRMLRTRDDLYAEGCTERDIHARVASGDLHRVRRGRYIEATGWKNLWSEGQHLVQVVAVHENSDAPGPVFWGPSAAVLHRLPLFRLAPTHVHAAILGERHGRSRAKVVWHNVRIADEDIVEVDGIRCTSLDQTVLDLACSTPSITGLSAADAALRREAVLGHEHDSEAAAEWHARLGRRAESVSVRGIRKARDVIAFADGRAQLPGESVSRLHLRELGFRDLSLQTHVVGPDGEDYWLDFGFPRSKVFGEFDGEAKYLDPALRKGRTLDEILLTEKRREDAIRGVTGWRTARWGWEHVRTPEVLAARLLAFGVRPPG